MRELTYKPSWKFELISMEPLARSMSWLGVRITCDQLAADGSGKPVNLTSTCMLGRPGELTRPEILVRIAYHLVEMEAHESKEWFKVSGVHVRAPHPEMAP